MEPKTEKKVINPKSRSLIAILLSFTFFFIIYLIVNMVKKPNLKKAYSQRHPQNHNEEHIPRKVKLEKTEATPVSIPRETKKIKNLKIDFDLDQEHIDSFGNKYRVRSYLLRDFKEYTQGLFFLDGILWESSGLQGNSKMIKYKIDGHVLNKEISRNLESMYFGEGSDFVIQNGKKYIYQLTWQDRVIFKYNDKLEILETIELPHPIKEGWGLARDWKQPNIVYISDGTNVIYECDAENGFRIIKQHKFSHNGRKLVHLNELEYINGLLYANVYMTTRIVELDIKNDTLKRIFDFSYLVRYSDKLASKMLGRRLENGECLNGIAFDQKSKRLILTGKNWPIMYDVYFDDPIFK